MESPEQMQTAAAKYAHYLQRARERQSEYYHANPEGRKEYARQYYQRTKELRLQQAKERYQLKKAAIAAANEED